jgi:hypothetical protein
MYRGSARRHLCAMAPRLTCQMQAMIRLQAVTRYSQESANILCVSGRCSRGLRGCVEGDVVCCLPYLFQQLVAVVITYICVRSRVGACICSSFCNFQPQISAAAQRTSSSVRKPPAKTSTTDSVHMSFVHWRPARAGEVSGNTQRSIYQADVF